MTSPVLLIPLCISDRRVIFDYKKFGDSPACLQLTDDVQRQDGWSQGYGLTLDGKIGSGPKLIDPIIESNLTILTNDECFDLIDEIFQEKTFQRKNIMSRFRINFCDGLDKKAIMCSEGKLWTSEYSQGQ